MKKVIAMKQEIIHARKYVLVLGIQIDGIEIINN